MRITENMRFTDVARSLSALRSRLADVTNQVSSGRRVVKPSDDPIAAAELTRISAREARTLDYQNTIGTVRSDLSLSESNLGEASGLMARAHEIAVQGANGSLSAADRKTLAAEVVSIREQLTSTANAKGTSGGYLFSGSKSSTAAFSSTGAYQGDNSEHQVEIAPGVVARVAVTGANAFGAAGGTDAFAVLDSLRQALVDDDHDAIAAALDPIEASRSQIVRAQSDAGLILNRLDTADEALSLTQLELGKRESELGAVDPFAALTELTQLSSTLEQAIAVARKTLNVGTDLF
jgi:flagellar hook-associated protein 3 FlgL